jgi:CheY-like chemotaxis protein
MAVSGKEVIRKLQRSEKTRIVIIDDNEDNRFIFRTYLEDVYDVVEFPDGEKAIVGMKTSPPDFVFLDISLPEMDGVEVLRRIREDERLERLPVFALTVHGMIGDRERFMAAGFDGYVSKPVLDFKALTRLIENASTKTKCAGGNR